MYHVARFGAKHGKLLLPQTFEESREFAAAVDEFFQGFPSQFGYGAPQQRGTATKERTNPPTKKPAAHRVRARGHGAPAGSSREGGGVLAPS